MAQLAIAPGLLAMPIGRGNGCRAARAAAARRGAATRLAKRRGTREEATMEPVVVESGLRGAWGWKNDCGAGASPPSNGGPGRSSAQSDRAKRGAAARVGGMRGAALARVMEEQGTRRREAQSLDTRQPWRGALRCMAATTPFRRTRGARRGARLGGCDRDACVLNWAMALE